MMQGIRRWEPGANVINVLINNVDTSVLFLLSRLPLITMIANITSAKYPETQARNPTPSLLLLVLLRGPPRWSLS